MKALFTLKYDCKHSRRYETDDEKFPIKDVYVQRPFCDGKDKIEIEIKEEK